MTRNGRCHQDAAPHDPYDQSSAEKMFNALSINTCFERDFAKNDVNAYFSAYVCLRPVPLRLYLALQTYR